MKNYKEKGFTLIEFMLVIALMGMGLLFVVSQFKDSGNQNKSQTAIKNITSLASAISSFRDLRSGFTGVTHTGIAASSAAPSNMVIGGVLTNVFGGAVTVSGNNTNYTVTYPSVPKKKCVDIASKLAGSFSVVYHTSVDPANQITDLAAAQSMCPSPSGALVFVGS